MIHAHRIFAALAAVAAIAISGAAFAQTKPANARDISIGLQAAITSMDPHYHNVGPNNSTLRHIFEPLVATDEKNRSCSCHRARRKEEARATGRFGAARPSPSPLRIPGAARLRSRRDQIRRGTSSPLELPLGQATETEV